MAFRGGGDAGGGVSSRDVKYERQIPKFLQKYKHMMTSGSFQQEARQAWEEYAPQMRAVVEDGADRDDELPTIVDADAMGVVAEKRAGLGAAAGSSRRAGLGSSEARLEQDIELKGRIEKLKTAGNEAFARGDHDAAIQSFSDAVKLDPQNHILLSNRSAAYCANKEYDSAIQDAEQCIALKKEWWKGFARKGAAYVGLQFWDEAIDAYKQALALSPDNENTIKALRQAVEAKAEEERLGKHVYRTKKSRKRKPSEASSGGEKEEEEDARKSSKKSQASGGKAMLSFDYDEEED